MNFKNYILISIMIISMISCSTQPELIEGNGLLVLKGVNLIDGTGADIKPNTEIIIRNGKIIKIGKVGDYTYAESPRVYDLTDRYVMPSFINVHFHVVRRACDETMKTLLAFGITTIRDPGALAGLDFNINLKKRLSSNEMIGPRLLTAGRIINGHSLYDSENIHPCSTEEEVREEVKKQIENGADFIKVFIHLPPDLIQAAINEAHLHGKKVIGHLGRTNWTQAANMGIDVLCHFHFLGPVWELLPPKMHSEFKNLFYPSPDNDYVEKFHIWLETIDLQGPEMRQLTLALKENAVFVTPTFIAAEVQVWGDDPASKEKYEFSFAPETRARRWKEQTRHPNTRDWSSEQLKVYKDMWPLATEIIRNLHENGVKLSAGTDHILAWLTPGISFHRELELMVEAGIPEKDVIKIATRNGAENLGILDETGTVEVGKTADLLVLTENPIVNIKNSRSIEMVIKNGNIYKSKELLEH